MGEVDLHFGPCKQCGGSHPSLHCPNRPHEEGVPDLRPNIKLPRGIAPSSIRLEMEFNDVTGQMVVIEIPSCHVVYTHSNSEMVKEWFEEKSELLRIHRIDMLRPYGTCKKCAHELYNDGPDPENEQQDDVNVYCPVCDRVPN